VLEELGFEGTEERGDFHDFPLAGSDEQDGACIISALRCDHPIVRKKTLEVLSSQCAIVACSIEEHVNYSSVAFWKNGKLDWSIEHRGDEDPENLTVTGAPDGLEQILRELPKDDPEVDDYFDVPLLMARKLTGFRHDENHPILDGRFQALLAATPAGAKSWWKFW